MVLIPASAHGTNPGERGAGRHSASWSWPTRPTAAWTWPISKRKADEHADTLACLMITYPSTHGVFEAGIRDVCAIVHEHGGQVYMDGANMNAQVGLTSPARIGADVCHLNLHKTFAIPHGGGGPGMGPIGVAPHLVPFLPGHPVATWAARPACRRYRRRRGAAPASCSSRTPTSACSERTGMTAATQVALLNANYIKSRLEPHYPVLYAGAHGRVAHELIFDLRGFKSAGIDEMDVAKRLIDYGFHAPTVSFPVAGTLMVEPTESEDLAELDRFCEAMIQIRQEIDDVVVGPRRPHGQPADAGAAHRGGGGRVRLGASLLARGGGVSRCRSCARHKFWPAVGRVDNPFGDRNLVCTCPPSKPTPDRDADPRTPPRCARPIDRRSKTSASPRSC